MKKLGSWGLLILAVLLAIAAFFLSGRYLASKEESILSDLLSSQGEKIEVVVASKNLEPGDVVSTATMAVDKAVKKNVSTYAITPADFKVIEGRVILRPMSAGEPLLSHAISSQRVERFSELLEDGERAVTLQVDEFSTAANMLVPGDYIDVYTYGKLPNPTVSITDPSTPAVPNTEKVLLPVLSRVRVLSTGSLPLLAKEQPFMKYGSPNGDGLPDYATITVGVIEKDATKLFLASKIGDVVALLRNPEDEEAANMKLVDGDLFTGGQAGSFTGYSYYSPNRTNGSVMLPVYTSFGKKLNASNERILIKSISIDEDN